MSIEQLHLVTIMGHQSDEESLLDGLQELGCLHIKPIRTRTGRTAAYDQAVAPEGGTVAMNARKALKFLTDAPLQRRQSLREEDFVLSEVVEQALDVKARLRVANDRYDFLKQRIADNEPWGELDLGSEGPPGGRRVWFYELPLSKRRALESVEIPWQIVGTDSRVAYVVLISPDEPPADTLPVTRVHLGSEPLAELRASLRDTEIELDDLQAERLALTRFVFLLRSRLYEAENAARSREASRAAFSGESLIALQGWVPASRLEDIEAFALEEGLALHVEEPQPGDRPPTLLEQPETRSAGVDLSMFYQIPNYRSWDPSLMLLVCFPIFFGMITADAGYGLVLAAALALFWRRLGRSAKGRSYRLLGLAIVASTVGYGALVGSYFGITPPADSVLARLQIMSFDDFDTMMKVSVGVGVAHVVAANIIAAQVQWSAPDTPARFGWIGVCLGAFALYLGGGSGIEPFAYGTLGLGALLILGFSSKRTERTLRGRLMRVVDGAQALTGAMTAFGDVLSYLRLFALGLASASLAATFNQLAGDVRSSLPYTGAVFAFAILLVGHALNLVLVIISGVVHGLRLNYIEFFKWGFDEEGVAFTPFSKKQVQS